ncbi:MAG: heparan-alpha-glucosaminide N-acetyltransferase domain-containing protein [Bacteroidota bacterium]|nr:heparan-alpha-glucosaminide N-acetyltransferase domain-containing protein [Bacteroidota bacterium]
MEQKSERLVSLDVFRGITIAGMIMVNNPGSWGHIYPALEHAKWHGVTPTDLIFPFFLFIVGVAITISLTKRKQRGDNLEKLLFQVAKRGLMIFLIGLLLASFPFFRYNPDLGFSWFDFSKIRIPGVLQRIGVVYFFASLIFLYTKPKTQAIIAAALLLIYWFLMAVVPVPGVGYPNFEPATNLGAWLDNTLLGGHLWSASKVWDPEGILSTIPSISTALCGILLGHWLKTEKDPLTKTVWMFVVGCGLLVLSMFWDMAFPINKGIWTSSYVVYCAGMALFFFATIYFLVDVKGYKRWTKPFVVYGMNAITVFFLSGVVARLLSMIYVAKDANGHWMSFQSYVYNNILCSFLNQVNASFAWALMYILFWLGMMWILYAKKIFIKV